MKIKVKLLKPFSDVAKTGQVDLDFTEGDINKALEELCKLHPDLKNEIFNEKDEIDFTVNIFINDMPMSALQNEDTKLSEGDELLLFMPVGGG
jgi:molybdopterin converting factor small subunit